MKLKELMKDQIPFRQEVLINREIEIQDKRALILGLREIEEFEDGEPEKVIKLMVLHEAAEWPDDEWDEDEWDDWDDEEQTNRQFLIENLETEESSSATDIDAFVINGVPYEVLDLDVDYLGEDPFYETAMVMKHFLTLAENAVSDWWLEKDLDELAVAEYVMEPQIFSVDWKADILNITAEIIPPMEEVLVGKVFKCSCGHYDVPKEFTIKGRDGRNIQGRLYGVYLHDIWSDPACLDMEFSELEELCGRDERLLLVDYSTDEDLQLDFYTKDYLDAAISEEDDTFFLGEAISIELSGDRDGRYACILDVVPPDFHDDVEIELLSYCED